LKQFDELLYRARRVPNGQDFGIHQRISEFVASDDNDCKQRKQQDDQSTDNQQSRYESHSLAAKVVPSVGRLFLFSDPLLQR
jgi:hypothetical protein